MSHERPAHARLGSAKTWSNYFGPWLLAVGLALPAMGCGSTVTQTTEGMGSTGEGTTTGAEVTCELQVFADTDGEPTGIEVCSNGARYRKEAVACRPRPLPPPLEAACIPPTFQPSECQSDDDCQAFPDGGRCYFLDVDGLQCGCHYDCTSDADCGPGAICLCGKGPATSVRRANNCVPTDGCQTDADCPDGERCLLGILRGEYCLGTTIARCTSPQDECAGFGDCLPSDVSLYPVCEYDAEQSRFRCFEESGCGE